MIQSYKSRLPCHPNSTTTRICPPKVTSAGLSGVRVPVYIHQRLPGLDCLGFISPVYVHQRLPLLDCLGFVSQYISTNGCLCWTVWGSYPQYMSTNGCLCWIIWGSCPSICPPKVTWAGLSGVRIPSIWYFAHHYCYLPL